jgi:hypothetical protein
VLKSKKPTIALATVGFKILFSRLEDELQVAVAANGAPHRNRARALMAGADF